MNDKPFLDSNILIYAFGNDKRKKDIAKSLLRIHPIISTQVINEVINVCLRKLGLSYDDIDGLFNLLKQTCEIKIINISTVTSALNLARKYSYSYFDSLILASALESNCVKIYSEDLQHNQLIENSLTIIDPFL